MKHWFIQWLLDRADADMVKAEEYRKAIKQETQIDRNLCEAFSDHYELLEWAVEAETSASRFKNWANSMEDMINCGLEELALKYYDARQSIKPWLMPPRPQKEINYKWDTVSIYLETRIKEEKDKDIKEDLNDIYVTIGELFETGMTDIAISYYLRKMQQKIELKLPAPETIILKDEESEIDV